MTDKYDLKAVVRYAKRVLDDIEECKGTVDNDGYLETMVHMRSIEDLENFVRYAEKNMEEK